MGILIEDRNHRYLGNLFLKKAGINLSFGQHEVDEWVKCRDDIVYFAKNYIKIKHIDQGLIDFDMWDFQEDLILQLQRERFSIVNTARQIGKTITTVTFLLHFILFNDFKDVGILANKGATARKILAKLQLAYEHLPIWLQQGVVEWNKGNIELENGSKVIATSTSSSAARGDSFAVVFVDEAAFVPTNIWEEFYNSVYPTISSGKHSKIILVSTPNGLNHFYKLFTFAEAGKNDYVPFTVTWRDVPGRDEVWRATEIRNTSAEQFQQEQECQFMGSSNTLVSSTVIKNMTPKDSLFVDNEKVYRVYELPIENHTYITSVDVARGRDLDSSAFSVIDITEYPFKQVATYRNNKISPLIFPDVIANVSRQYNEAYVLVENNDAGEEVLNILNYDVEYGNIISPRVSKKFQLGLRTTPSVKRLGCSNFKDLVEHQKLVINDEETINEIAGFVVHGKSYKADGDGHDDLVMGLVIFSWLTTQNFFEGLVDLNARNNIFASNIKAMEEELTPFGHISNGVSDPHDPDTYTEGGELWSKVDDDDSGWGF